MLKIKIPKTRLFIKLITKLNRKCSAPQAYVIYIIEVMIGLLVVYLI